MIIQNQCCLKLWFWTGFYALKFYWLIEGRKPKIYSIIHVWRLMVPLSYTAIFSCMLVKFSFLIILTKEQHLSSGYQIFSLILLISVQLVVSSYLFIANKPDIIMEDTNFQGKEVLNATVKQFAWKINPVIFLLSSNAIHQP